MGYLLYVACYLTFTAWSQGAPVEDKSPPFCRNLECPKYKVGMKTDDFEERCYQTYKWASTVVADVDYNQAVETGFFRLFDYISGANKQKVKIPMTAPVAVDINPGAGPFCASNFTVNFFVPFESQDNPPEPTEQEVYIRTFEKHCQYVGVYPGFSNSTLVQKMALKLATALDKAGLASGYVKEPYFFAGYDSPTELFNRHNEIWFLKKVGLKNKIA